MPEGFVSDRNKIRLAPYEGQASSSPAPQNSAAMNSADAAIASAGSAGGVLADGVLDEDEKAALQTAADAGDAEASSLLQALGIGLGVAATGAAGYGLYRALKNRQPGQMASPKPQQAQAAPVKSNVPAPRASTELDIPIEHLDWETVPHPHEQVEAPKGAALLKAVGALRRMR